MQKQLPVYGLQDLPMNVKKMTIKEHHILFNRFSFYSFNRACHLRFYLDNLKEQIDNLKKDIIRINDGSLEDKESLHYEDINDVVPKARRSLQSEVDLILSQNYKSYPFGYKLLYLLKDKGAAKYPTQETWNENKKMLLELKDAFSSDEHTHKWMAENCPDYDMSRHLQTVISVPIPQLQKDDTIYAVYMSNQEEMLEGRDLFYIDEYNVDFFHVGRYGRTELKPADNSYYASLTNKDKNVKHKSFNVNIHCQYKDGKMSWVHSHCFLSLFSTREAAEEYIESIKENHLVA